MPLFYNFSIIILYLNYIESRIFLYKKVVLTISINFMVAIQFMD